MLSFNFLVEKNWTEINDLREAQSAHSISVIITHTSVAGGKSIPTFIGEFLHPYTTVPEVVKPLQSVKQFFESNGYELTTVKTSSAPKHISTAFVYEKQEGATMNYYTLFVRIYAYDRQEKDKVYAEMKRSGIIPSAQ